VERELAFSGSLLIYYNNMENKEKFRPHPRLKRMEQVRQVMRYHHYASLKAQSSTPG
jgi:hypothetical protein